VRAVLAAVAQQPRLIILGDHAGGDDDEKPAHRLSLAAFEISQYPITNAQFQAFVAGGGYGQGRYWREAEAAGYWQDGYFKGLFDNQPRRGAYDFGPPFHLPNQPVVGVSWYEAVAFCPWLSDQLGYPVRLPTAALGANLTPGAVRATRLASAAIWKRAASGAPAPWASSRPAKAFTACWI